MLKTIEDGMPSEQMALLGVATVEAVGLGLKIFLGLVHAPIELCLLGDGLIFELMALMKAGVEEAVDWCL